MKLSLSPTTSTHASSSFFFFSSRRRHTRYWRDWSSDVCSSDLLQYHDQQPVVFSRHRRPGDRMHADPRSGDGALRRGWHPRRRPDRPRLGGRERSEERRVGKEWRGRGWRWELKENDIYVCRMMG